MNNKVVFLFLAGILSVTNVLAQESEQSGFAGCVGAAVRIAIQDYEENFEGGVFPLTVGPVPADYPPSNGIAMSITIKDKLYIMTGTPINPGPHFAGCKRVDISRGPVN